MGRWRTYAELPRAVRVLCVGTLINRVGGLLVPFLTLYLCDELGFDVTFATLAMGAFGLGAVASALVGGHLADVLGRRVVMLIALLGGASVLAVFPTLTSRGSIIAGVACFAFLSEMYRPATQAMIGDLVEPARRPEAFGLMYLAINLGFSVAPPLGGWLASVSFRILIWFDAATAVAYAVIIIIFIRETLPARSASAPTSGAGEPIGVWAVARRIASDRPFVIFCAATLGVGMVYMQSISTLPLYLRARGFGPGDYGLVMMTNGVMIVFLQLPLVSLISRWNRAAVMSAAAIVTGIGFGATAMADILWHFVATVAIWTAGEMMSAPFGSAIVSDFSPVSMRGRYMGVYSMCFSSANMIGAPIGGMVMTHYGAPAVWGACVVVSVMAAMLYLSIHGRINRPQASGPLAVDP